MIRPSTVRDLLAAYAQANYLKPSTLVAYWTTVHSFEAACGGYALLTDLTEEMCIAWLSELRQDGCAPDTFNRHRTVLLTLWKFASKRGLTGPPAEISRAPRARRVPTAWTVEEIGRILAHSGHGLPRRRGDWSADHWRGVVLVIFDTSLRIDCLLRAPRSAVSFSASCLTLPAELQKDHADTRHLLHPQTLEILRSLPETERLFPWPLGSRRIWTHFRKILHAAGLPITRRDLFHRIRRSSYTHVWALCGPGAASVHAGHSHDLSASYLDPIVARSVVSPIDVLPRPTL